MSFGTESIKSRSSEGKENLDRSLTTSSVNLMVYGVVKETVINPCNPGYIIHGLYSHVRLYLRGWLLLLYYY